MGLEAKKGKLKTCLFEMKFTINKKLKKIYTSMNLVSC